MKEENIHVCSRGVIISQDHILLAYDPRPHPYHYYELDAHFYYLPGGHIDFQESAHSALIREIKEETGYDATIEKFFGIIEHAWHFPGDEVCCHTHEINLIFNLSVPQLTWRDAIPQKEDHVAFQWISLETLHKTDLRPSLLKSALPQWLKGTDTDVLWSTMTSHKNISTRNGG